MNGRDPSESRDDSLGMVPILKREQSQDKLHEFHIFVECRLHKQS